MPFHFPPYLGLSFRNSLPFFRPSPAAFWRTGTMLEPSEAGLSSPPGCMCLSWSLLPTFINTRAPKGWRSISLTIRPFYRLGRRVFLLILLFGPPVMLRTLFNGQSHVQKPSPTGIYQKVHTPAPPPFKTLVPFKIQFFRWSTILFRSFSKLKEHRVFEASRAVFRVRPQYFSRIPFLDGRTFEITPLFSFAAPNP